MAGELVDVCETQNAFDRNDRRSQVLDFLRDAQAGLLDPTEIKDIGQVLLLSEFVIVAAPFDDEVAGGDGSTHVRIYFSEPSNAIEIWILRAHKKDFTGDDQRTRDDQNRNIRLADRRRINWLHDDAVPHVG